MTALYNHFSDLCGGTRDQEHSWNTNYTYNAGDSMYTATGGVAVGNSNWGQQAYSLVGSWVTDDTCNDVNDYRITAQTSNDVSLPRSRRSRKKRSDECTSITTVNTTNQGPMLEYLENVKPWGVELVQEHHVQVAGMLATTAKVRKLGYKFCATPAVASGRSEAGSSGGAAVIVRNCYGVKKLFGIQDESQPWMIYPGRAAGARILGMIRGGIIFVSLYLKSGEKPNSMLNWAILTRVAEILNLCQIPFVIGGDFQCTPQELRDTQWLDILKGVIVSSGQVTCTTVTSAREIDFFVASKGMESVLEQPEPMHGTCIATHCPVGTTMMGNPRALTVKGFVMPVNFPRREPYGPVRKVRPWAPFAPSEGADSHTRMQELASYWMQNAEEELCQQYDLVDDDTGAPLGKFCGRAEKPVVADMRPMQHHTTGDVQSGVRGTYWQSISNRLSEISRWFSSYRSCTDDSGTIYERGLIWEQFGYTQHVVAAAKKLVNRFYTPPKTILRTDPDLIDLWRKRILHIIDMMQYILFGANVIGTECIVEWTTQVDALVTLINTQLVATRGVEFGDWLDQQLKKGAGGIHAATKEQMGCFADPIDSLGPGTHAAQEIVDLEITKWAQPRIWRAWPTQIQADSDYKANAWFDRQDDFPALRAMAPVAEIRCTSGTFPWKTCIGADGLHPRIVGQLSSTGLRYLSLLQSSAEALSQVPEIFRINTLFTRPKKNGTYRTVGSLPTFYRIYAKQRLKYLRDWEINHPCDLFWAAKGKGADVAVHTAATAAEIAKTKGHITAAALVDIFKCFEIMNHNTIIRKCMIVQFPMDILAVALSMYSAARYLILNGAMGGPVFTHRGITAGCSFAVYILRATMQADIIVFYGQHCKPYGVMLQIFVDDLLVMYSGLADMVVARLSTATDQLVKVLCDMDMPAADDKKFIIASPAIGGRILERLEDKEFQHRVVGEQLGVDFAPGRRAGNCARDKRAMIFGARLPKIRCFTKKRGAVGKRLAATAGIPSIGYSTMVLGTSTTRLAWHQTLMHRTLTSTNTQRNKHLSLSVAGQLVEPAYGANSAPPMQWARTVHKRVFDLSELRKSVQFYQQRMKLTMYPWAIVTGTITALLATLQRIGWSIVGAHLYKDHNGEYMDARSTPWRTLQAKLDEATNIWLWQRHTKGSTAAAMFAKGASSEIVQQLTGTSSSLDKEHRHALLSASTGGQWPQDRHVKADHDVSDLCWLCGTAPGTEWHRVFDCPATEHMRTIHLDLRVQRLAAPHACSHHPRWTRGHLPMSAFPAPPVQSFGNRCMWFREEAGVFMGEAFLDGSSSNPTRLDLSASACSIVGMQIQHGMPRMDLRLDVALDQGLDGPEAAEISAVEFLLRNCVLPLVAWSDCQNVVDAFERGRMYSTSPEHAYCVYWRRVHALLDDHACPGGLVIRKVKAHTNATNFGDYGLTYLQWQGNRNADKGALTTAQHMAQELNLKGWAQERTEIEADHRGLCKWIALITAHVNKDSTRDAIPMPDDVARTAKNKVPSNCFRGKSKKRVRLNIPDATKMFGKTECTEIQDYVTHGTYACLTTVNKRYRLNSKTTRDVAASMGFDENEYDQMDFDWEPNTDDRPESIIVDPSSNLGTEILEEDQGSETLEDMLTEVLNMDADMNNAEEQQGEEPDVGLRGHGGLLLQTAYIVWCVKCGGSAQLGATSKHLREVCKGKPQTASMRQRRNRLVRGKHPTTCAPLNAVAKRVTVL